MVIIEKNKDDEITEQLSSVPSYYEVKLKQRKEAEIRRDNELKELFLNALSFYLENYPKSFQKRSIVWNESKKDFKIDESILLSDTLERLNVDELYHMAHIIKYNVDEHNYKKVPTRNQFNSLRGRIIKMIPGGRESIEIKALQDKQNITKIKIKELENLKKKKEAEFEVRLKEIKETPIEKIIEEVIEEPVNKIVGKKCPYCEEIKGNKAGMTSHVMHKHKTQYEDFKVKFKEQMWEINETE
jgi:hypothetical protein